MLLLVSNSPIKTGQNDTPHEVGVTLFRVRDFALNSSYPCAFGSVDGAVTDVLLWAVR